MKFETFRHDVLSLLQQKNRVEIKRRIALITPAETAHLMGALVLP